MSKWFESGKVQVKALIVGEATELFSHWTAKKSLSQWLKEQNVPAMHGAAADVHR